MKKYISKRWHRNNLFLTIIAFWFVSIGSYAYCQESSTMTITGESFSMTPQYTEKEMDSLKWQIVTHGDESCFFECQQAIWSMSNGSATVLYTEFLPYTLIMAFVYEFPAACYYVYTILSNYHKERGENLSDDEIQLCIKGLTIGSMKGCMECEELKTHLSSNYDRKTE